MHDPMTNHHQPRAAQMTVDPSQQTTQKLLMAPGTSTPEPFGQHHPVRITDDQMRILSDSLNQTLQVQRQIRLRSPIQRKLET